MLNIDNIANLLGFKDAKIKNMETIGKKLIISMEMPKCEHRCPGCGNMTSYVNDYREQYVKDIDILDFNTVIKYKKRRYICPVCKKAFFENNPIVNKWQRNTQRLFLSVLEAFRNKLSATDIAKKHNISTTTALKYFDVIDYHCDSLPEVLSIDEFKGNAGGEKYQCAVADAKNHKLIDILPNRKELDLIHYFSQFKNRDKVKYVVIDMNGHFDRVAHACFPNAVIIADRYHTIRQVFWAMENVRKDVQNNLSKKFRIYFKRSKSLLAKHPSNLTDEQANTLSLMFEISPILSDAYYIKNKFIDVMNSNNSIEGLNKLKFWLSFAESKNIPQFKACTNCYRNWSPEILHSLDFPYSNGFIEGCNNKTKVIKRITFGMRNFKHLRNRILHAQ